MMSKEDSSLSKTKTSPQQALDNLLDKPIISVKEARKLLGSKYEHQSDEQILSIICSMRITAEVLLESVIIRSTKQEGDIIQIGETK